MLYPAVVKEMSESGSVYRLESAAMDAPARLIDAAQAVSTEKLSAQHTDSTRTDGHQGASSAMDSAGEAEPRANRATTVGRRVWRARAGSSFFVPG